MSSLVCVRIRALIIYLRCINQNVRTGFIFFSSPQLYIIIFFSFLYGPTIEITVYVDDRVYAYIICICIYYNAVRCSRQCHKHCAHLHIIVVEPVSVYRTKQYNYTRISRMDGYISELD